MNREELMKRLTKTQIDLQADKIIKGWICQYGLKNANKVSLAVRRKIRRQSKVSQATESSRRHLRGRRKPAIEIKVAG